MDSALVPHGMQNRVVRALLRPSRRKWRLFVLFGVCAHIYIYISLSLSLSVCVCVPAGAFEESQAFFFEGCSDAETVRRGLGLCHTARKSTAEALAFLYMSTVVAAVWEQWCTGGTTVHEVLTVFQRLKSKLCRSRWQSLPV